MVDLSSKRRMAAEVLGVGRSRIRLDPDATEQLQDAITRESIRGWISAGLIGAKPARGNSRGRVRQRRYKAKLRGKGCKGGKEEALGGSSQDVTSQAESCKRQRFDYEPTVQNSLSQSQRRRDPNKKASRRRDVIV